MSSTCPSCAEPTRETDKFCSNCGTRLRLPESAASAPVSCRACGAELPDGAKFCGNCGIADPATPVDAGDAAVSPVAQAPGIAVPAGTPPKGDTVVTQAPSQPAPYVEPDPLSADEADAPPQSGPGPTSSLPPDEVPSPLLDAEPKAPLPGERPIESDDAVTVPRSRIDEDSRQVVVGSGAAAPSSGRRLLEPLPKPPPKTGAKPPPPPPPTGQAAKKVPDGAVPPVRLKPKASATDPSSKTEAALPKTTKGNGASTPKPSGPPWTDLTDEIAEIQFLILQGLEDDAREAVAKLRSEHPGHPDLAEFRVGDDDAGAVATEAADAPGSAPVEVDDADESAEPPARIRVSVEPEPDDDSAASADEEPPAVEQAPGPFEGDGERWNTNVFDDAPDTEVDHGMGPAEPTRVTHDDSGEEADRIATVSGEVETTSQGTVVARSPAKPAPYEGAPPSDGGAKPRPRRVTVVPDDPDRPPPPAPFGGDPPPGPPGSGSPEPDAEPMGPKGNTLVPEAGSYEAAATGDDTDEPPQTTEQGTVIAPNPLPPQPFEGEPEPAASPAVAPIRLVMRGASGEIVGDRVVEPGTDLEIGSGQDEPWGDDPNIEPRHARVRATADGLAVEALDAENGVFRQLTERLEMRDGDAFRIGTSLLTFERHATGPNAGAFGRVTVVLQQGARQAYPLQGSGLLVGREDADITFPGDTYVSGEHCRISCDDDTVRIEDLQSSNGTYVRLRKGEVAPIGALLLMGHTRFEVGTTR